MNDFKSKKGKALVNALAQQANEKSIEVIGLLADKYPTAASTLGILQASFGVRIAYKQEILNQFTEYIMSKPDVFTKAVLASPELNDGLIVFMGTYFRLRSDEKRSLAQKIFYDFGQSNAMPLYPLERYDDTLEKISDSGIRMLGFIYNEVPKLKIEYTETKMYEHGNNTDTNTKEKWIEIYTGTESLTTFMEEYIKKQTTAEMKDYKGDELLTEESRIKSELREPMYVSMTELEQLGLMHGSYREGGWGPGSYIYNLTDYGNKFTSVIKP